MRDTERNSLDDLPKRPDGRPNLHRFGPASILLRIGGSVLNRANDEELSQYVTCLLHAIVQLETHNPDAVQRLEIDIRNFWLRLPRIPVHKGEFREMTPEEQAAERRSIDIQQLSTGAHVRIMGLRES